MFTEESRVLDEAQVTGPRVRPTDMLVVLLALVVAARFLLPGAFAGDED